MQYQRFIFRVNPVKEPELFSFLKQNTGNDLSHTIREALKQYINQL